ncbi:DUF2254 domain-containing protein [Bacillus sp. FJAT-44742]|uniref:DUF2254 domain-containing protein n=1 Tax=Bacillus sp. FJAT-44742 TaxID=2014005 RepID=UPI000C233A05|nr:DUF2254 domain-containing protein [Bacillus sp. FJAT-44742]
MVSSLKKISSKYNNLSRRQIKNELNSQIWFTPLLYSIGAIILVFLTLSADYSLLLGEKVPDFFSVSFELTNTLISTLMPAILTLTAFTFNLVLVAFATFSGQFSPRVLKNFTTSKTTQRILGIFNGSFLFTLIIYFFLSGEQVGAYFAIPVMATFLAGLCAGIFVHFINHSVKWMQVNNMTQKMKKDSKTSILLSLRDELEPYRHTNYSRAQQEIPVSEPFYIKAPHSGYIQIVDFIKLVKYAKKDHIIVKLECDIGDHVLKGAPLLSYWPEENQQIDEKLYLSAYFIGSTQTDIQDIRFNLSKFVEIAIRSLGNFDTKTASNAIFQISDLLRVICEVTKFMPFLMDEKGNLRVILIKYDFSDYLYYSYSSIRHHARDNVSITIELLKALTTLSQSVDETYKTDIWNFALYIVNGFNKDYLFSHDKRCFYEALENLAITTDHQESFNDDVKIHGLE